MLFRNVVNNVSKEIGNMSQNVIFGGHVTRLEKRERVEES